MTAVPARTIAEVLSGLLSADASRPLVTFYDDATGERVELSVKSFDNWVAKTANLLQHGLSAESGERVAFALPTHWQGMVWLCAAWSCGLVTVLDGSAGAGADYAVVGPQPARTDARHTVALSLQPLGAGFAHPLPPGVLDYSLEVPGYADSFQPLQPVPAELPALPIAETVLRQADLVAHGAQVAARLELGAAARLLTDANPCSVEGVGTALLAPLVTGGSVVLVAHPDPAREAARVSQERISARAVGTGGGG